MHGHSSALGVKTRPVCYQIFVFTAMASAESIPKFLKSMGVAINAAGGITVEGKQGNGALF